MPAFSGLWDGTHGQSYANMPKSDALPPHSQGIIRVFMQRRGMHGIVNALGQDAPATIARINANRDNITVPGTFDYSAWKAAKYTPGAGIARDVTVADVGSHMITGTMAVDETIARPTDATANALTQIFDTTHNHGYPGDASGNPATGPALAESVET